MSLLGGAAVPTFDAALAGTVLLVRRGCRGRGGR